jgi:hypothetical protein
MRNLFIGLLIGFLLAVPIAYTQQQPESIEVGGVLLRLGMAQDSAISKIAEKGGLTINKVNDSHNWLVSRKNDKGEYDAVGMLLFTESRLSWVSRSWAYSTDPGAAKIARNVYFLLKSFEDEGNTVCIVETSTNEGPDVDNRGIRIQCRRREARLFVTAYKGQATAASLDEAIK